MKFAFDLISDLHIETWQDFDWSNLATSPICVLAGDVAKDKALLEETLDHLSRCYQVVFYIDGNDEHKYDWNDLGKSYKDINAILKKHQNTVYLQNNVIITGGVAILSTNGWWSWDFDPTVDAQQSRTWWCEKSQCHSDVADLIHHLAESDAKYLASSIARLQTHKDVKKIVLVTHTVPDHGLVSHDIDLEQTYRINVMGNTYMKDVLQFDTENKVSHWCFGHYHGSIDKTINGVRYVNNCRGRGDTAWRQTVYHPLRIEVDV